MQILAPTSAILDLDDLADGVTEPHHAILDTTDPDGPDYRFLPTVYLDVFNAPTVFTRIGNHRLALPATWFGDPVGIMIADQDTATVDVIALTVIDDRPFQAFAFDPLHGSLPEYPEIVVESVGAERWWHVPRLRAGQFLAIPLRGTLCVLIGREIGEPSFDVASIVG